MKISRYLSPQIYKSIFSGQKDVTIHTERKKLTIFFSDIKDFTATTERLQPEQITALLNEYFTEMSTIALRARRHHRQVHRRRHADLLRRSRRPRARPRTPRPACAWRSTCSTGSPSSTPNGAAPASSSRSASAWASTPAICNVGNFGSDDRMDYTIIGAEANLAARLQSIAEPGQHRAQLRDLCAGARHRRAPTRCRRSR